LTALIGRLTALIGRLTAFSSCQPEGWHFGDLVAP